MTTIDELLSEAKPLYKRRQKERKIVSTLSVLGICLVSGLYFQRPSVMPSGIIYDVWAEEIYQAENGSVVEDLGLPTDDYGLLLIG